MLKSLVLLFALALSGCSISSVGNAGGTTEHHFGYVRIHTPKTHERLTAQRVTTVGMNLNPGVTLGYRESEQIVNPIDPHTGAPACSVTILVRDRAEALFVEKILQQLEETEICTAHF